MFKYEYWGSGTFSAKDNMALEEFFLQRARKNAVVRLFDFEKDSVVLGYAQHTDAVKNPLGASVVRRLTGGSHVHVGQNILAYTFAVPRTGEFSNFEDMRAYYAEHVAGALEDIGLDNITIDNRASTINQSGKVVAAHAMIWGIESALLHGLIIIDPYDADKIAERVFLQERKIGNKYYSEYSALKNIPAISLQTEKARYAKERTAALKRIVGDAILKRVAKDPVKKNIDSKIIYQANEIQKNKYSTQKWIRARKPPFTEEEIESIPGEELHGPLEKNLGYCMYLQVSDKKFKGMAASD